MFGSLTGESSSPQPGAEPAAASETSGAVIDAWLSSVAGLESSEGLRQGLAALALAEAAQAAASPEDVDALTAAAEGAAAPLVDWAADEASVVSSSPATSAAAAAALAALSALPSVTDSQRGSYGASARHVIALLAESNLSPRAQHSSSFPAAADSILLSAGRWLSNLINDEPSDAALQQQHSNRARLLRGGSSEETAQHQQHHSGTEAATSQPVSILVGVDGVEGSMLADALLLQAVLTLRLTVA